MVSYEDTGLRAVRAATTRISLVDGNAGRLLYRGYSIEELATRSNFEEVTYLLLYGSLPTSEQLKDLSGQMAAQREVPRGIIKALTNMPKDTPPMSVIQAGVALLSGYCPDVDDESEAANIRKAIKVISSMPTLVAAWKRIKSGNKPVVPREDLSLAANFLYMIDDIEPDPSIARFLDVALVLHAEHSFNASTFATRVVASTGADLFTSISAGIGALSGPLHGGANAQVMRNLIDTNDIEKVESWVLEQFKNGKRVSGMGHAVYKTIDPRAVILQNMAKELLKDHPEYRWVALTDKMAEATQKYFKKNKRRDIYPNVDLYSASIYHAMGIHLDTLSPRICDGPIVRMGSPHTGTKVPHRTNETHSISTIMHLCRGHRQAIHIDRGKNVDHWMDGRTELP